MQRQQCWDDSFYTSFGWSKFAYVINPIPPQTRRVTFKLHSQGRFSILPVLYTQDTFTLVLNFEVDHFVRHFLLLSVFLLVLLWKEFNSQNFIVTFHFTRSFGSPPVFYPAGDGCWIHVNAGCSAFIYSLPLIVSLNDEPRLAHRRQQSAVSAFQFHNSLIKFLVIHSNIWNHLNMCKKWVMFNRIISVK